MDALRKQKFNQAMFSKNRTLAIRVGKYQSSDIKEASFDYGYIKGDAYKPGGTCAGSAKIVFSSIITTFNKLDKVYPEVGLLVDGTYEWVKMGEYFINDIEIDRNRNTTKLDLMDGMFKLNREHVTDLSYPAEIRHVIKEICLKTGITLANEYMDITSMNYRIESIPKEKKMTFRDVLSLATQMLGMSCFFNREGKLEIKGLTDSGITITADSYFMHGLTKSEIEYQIAGISCKKNKEVLTVGLRTGRSLEIENLLMSQSALDNLYHNIKDIRYYPFNLNYQGHLLLDVGQWVTIKTNTGETFKSPVLSQSFTFKGGLRGRISADSKAGNDAQYSYAGTITKKIEQFNEIEAQIQSQLEEADKGFDQKVEKIKNDFSDQVELAKAKTEEVKRELSDTINQRFSSFDNGPLQEAKRRAEEALRNAGASSLLAQEAKQIGLDSAAKLEEFKRQATSAQSALSWNLDTLKRTVTSEANQASEYRRTTTEALSRMTGQMNGFATKSEVKQDIDGLTQTFAKMRVGGVNLLRNTASLLIGDRSKGYWMSSSGGNGRAISVEVLDPPKNMIKNMIRIIGNTNGGNKDLAQIVRLLIGEKYTISCYARVASDSSNANVNLLFRSWANDTDLNQKFQKSISHKNWEKYSFTFTANAIENSIQFGQSGAGIIEICAPKIESGTLATDWSPALEDTEGIITEAKATFERTAQGLRTDLSAIQEYVNKDGQRQEALQRYTREESAKQATAVRELVARDYVGKATYQEDVRGLERRLSAISTQTSNDIATKIAQYKQTVDGQFLSITSQIAGKANQTDFQRVQETSQLYERIIGSNENDISNRVARMAVTNQIFQVEVGKYGGGGPNLVKNSDFKDGMNEWTSKQNLGRLVKHGFYHNSQKDLMRLSNSTQSDIFLNSPRFELERNTDYVLNFRGFNNGALVSYDVFILGRKAGETSDFSIAKKVIDSKKLSTSKCEDVSITFNSGEMDNAYIRFDNNGSLSGTADLYITEVDLYKGYKPRPWQPHPEDIVTDANAKLEATQTKMTQLAGSWAVQNLTSAGALVSGLNLGANGHNRLDGKLTHITGETLIDKAVIKSAMIDKLKTANFEAGSVTTVILDAEAVTAEKLKVDQAFFNKLVANEAYLSQLFAKQAFINRVQSVAINASQVKAGFLSGDRILGGTITGSNIYGGTLTGHTQIQLGTYGSFDVVNGGIQINVPREPDTKDGLGVQFIGSYGRGENVPYGLFIYKDSDFTVGGAAETSDGFLLTVEGYIQAKGIGWLKTGKGSVSGKTTGTIGFWDSNNVSLSFGGLDNDIYYSYNGKAYSLWSVVDQHFSDRRLKENIVDCKHKALDYIHQFRFKEYDWKKQEDRPQKAHTRIGLIAQEVQAVDPTLVYENGDTLNLDNLRLTNIALKAIQELSQRIETLERKLA